MLATNYSLIKMLAMASSRAFLLLRLETKKNFKTVKHSKTFCLIMNIFLKYAKKAKKFLLLHSLKP